MQIYYFSRTGRSKAVAEQIASRYHTTARMIDDHKDWNGKVNYMKAGAMALSWVLPDSGIHTDLSFSICAE